MAISVLFLKKDVLKCNITIEQYVVFKYWAQAKVKNVGLEGIIVSFKKSIKGQAMNNAHRGRCQLTVI